MPCKHAYVVCSIPERAWRFFSKLIIDTLESFDEEKRCRFEDQRKETRIYSGPASITVFRERMLEFYSDQSTQFIHKLALDVIQVLESSNYFQSC